MAKRKSQKKDVSSKNLTTIILIIGAAFLISGGSFTGAFSWSDLFNRGYIPPQPIIVPTLPTVQEPILQPTISNRVGVEGSISLKEVVEVSTTRLSVLLSAEEALENIDFIIDGNEQEALDSMMAAGTNLYCLCADHTKNGCLKPTKVACDHPDSTVYGKSDVPSSSSTKTVEEHCLWKCGGAPILVTGGIAFSGC
ncbi:MAG: hypothetical protein Q8R00_04435 [Candidatus Nanoarchaeia archaeon]|nr:hypothetical protein [Candidatus Nanoarchaeia archaeon]